MRKSIRFSVLLLMTIFSLAAFAQTTTLSGRVTNITNLENVPAVSVMVKGSTQGTFTDENGIFRITVPALPVTLVFTSIGFEPQEVLVENASTNIEVNFYPSSSITNEVVVSATRTPQRILEAPVTVERMSGPALRNLAAPNYYEAITNLKGVDMHTASLTFRTVTTRGFISSGNTRLNQLIDGMDNQAPGLNFSVGSIIGPTELDVDNIELLAGASSALYGSGGINGTLLINSKNPFRYQGLSVQVKQGIMHINDRNANVSPYYDWGFRYGKAFKDKFAFKIAAQFIKANDWVADDYRNVNRTGVISKVVDGDRQSDPNYDGINMYGDETTANMQQVAQGVLFAGTQAFIQQYVAATGMQPSQAQINGFLATNPQTSPFYNGLNAGLIPNQNVSRTGYEERSLVDYNTMNFKFTGGLFYKITPNIEASWNSYLGTGTTVYTGADRYALKNLKMAQHKLEVRSNSWFLRGYTTQENAGDSYNATVLGRLVNEAWKGSTTWYPQYVGAFLQARAAGAPVPTAHNAARSFADQGRITPGTTAFATTVENIKNLPIPQGAKFLDKSDLYAAEGQLNFSDVLGFSNAVEMIVGAQWKQYVLNSQGTIFADTAGSLKPAEYGGYVQLRKKLLNDVLTITAAGRYDKHTNFEGRFTPRVTAVIRVAKDNNVRLSYQTAYRFPTNQDQYINLNVGSGILIGGLPEFQTYYNLNTNPGYTAESVQQYRATGNSAVLVQAMYENIRPETVASYEVGYRGVMGRKFLLDAYAYYSQYQDFLGRVAVIQSLTGSQTGLLNPSSSSSRNLSYLQTTEQDVNAFGWGVTAEYELPRRFIIYGNVFSDKLRVDDEMVSSKDRETQAVGTFFNTPDLRYNIGLRNENIGRNIGFNVVYKWQAENYYEGTFVTGTLPAFGTLDAQITYKMPKTKTIFRVGGTNITNSYYRSGFGSPYVGGLYYVSFGYNIY